GRGHDVPPLGYWDLHEFGTFIVLLSRVALASARMRDETQRYIELATGDRSRLVLPVAVEPIDRAKILPCLRPYPLIASPPGEGWPSDMMVRRVLHELGGPFALALRSGEGEQRQLPTRKAPQTQSGRGPIKPLQRLPARRLAAQPTSQRVVETFARR